MKNESEPASQAIYTIGYGHRSLVDFIGLLERFEISFVGDVRSRPYSRFNPDFSRDNLADGLNAKGIRYVFLGDTLGGDPESTDVRLEVGDSDVTTYIVDYDLVREQPAFQSGMKRLHSAWNQRVGLALMCSEARPEQCHRVRMIGVQLKVDGIPVLHIDEHGAAVDQDEAMRRIDKGQATLPGFGNSPKASRSSRTWRDRAETSSEK